MLKIALFTHFSASLDIITNFFPFLNFGEIEISSKKSFITSTTGVTTIAARKYKSAATAVFFVITFILTDIRAL